MMSEAAHRLGQAPTKQHHARRVAVIGGVDGVLLPRGGTRDPGYWGGQLLAPVRFLAAIRTAMTVPDPVFVEVGPGKALTAAVRQIPEAGAAIKVALQAGGQDSVMAGAARLWAAGVDLRWEAVREREGDLVWLPPHPFERNEYPLRSGEAPRDRPVDALVTADTSVGGRIRALWAELLGSEEVRPGSNFFELGGESLLFIRMVARLQRMFGVELDVDAVSRNLTPDVLTAAVLAAREGDRDDVGH
jgi:acyl transferase domain-containing protein